ncbi:MAG: protein kinase [Planctomycetales bacterium]|nr:protein kinase [Planctomycetales bacterium]
MANNTDTCLSLETLSRLEHNTLTPDELSELEAHLSGCERCRRFLDDADMQPQWRDQIRPVLLNRLDRDSRLDGDPGEATDFLGLLGPTDDPRMLGRIGMYEVSGLIGRGGMGIVFKAFDPSLDRFVAIKMLAPHLATSAAARQRFVREGKAAAAVVDDHVLPVYGVDEWKGIPYLVLQYSRGLSLQQRINNQGPLEVVEVLRIGLQIARGLAAAHAQGLVHRDVKPSNILLCDSVERAVLTDFGLARAVDDASMTRTGVVAGTPQYMSPEQARAESIDQRSDLFSLGSVMYAMCTGHAPFRAETSLGVLRLISDRTARPIQEINPAVPSWVCELVDKLMTKDPDKRIATAGEVADILEGCLAHVQQPKVYEVPRQLSCKRGVGKSKFGKWIALALAVTLLITASTIVVLESSKGTITISSEADDVPIQILRGDEVVDRLTVRQLGKNVRVAAGEYEVIVDGEFDGIAIVDGTVTLKRGGTEQVRIVRSDSSVDEASEAAALSDFEVDEARKARLWRRNNEWNFAKAMAVAKRDWKTEYPERDDVVTIDVYCGRDVLPQMNSNGPNSKRHNELLIALNAIKGVIVNLKEAGDGNTIKGAVIRDPSNLIAKEGRQNGLPTGSRAAIIGAMQNAQVHIHAWQVGVSLQVHDAMLDGAKLALGPDRSSTSNVDRSDPKAVVEAYIASARLGKVDEAASFATSVPAERGYIESWGSQLDSMSVEGAFINDEQSVAVVTTSHSPWSDQSCLAFVLENRSKPPEWKINRIDHKPNDKLLNFVQQQFRAGSDEIEDNIEVDVFGDTEEPLPLPEPEANDDTERK